MRSAAAALAALAALAYTAAEAQDEGDGQCLLALRDDDAEAEEEQREEEEEARKPGRVAVPSGPGCMYTMRSNFRRSNATLRLRSPTCKGAGCCQASERWTDYEGFDCASYVGSAWCTPDGGYGSGWCGWWGTFKDQSGASFRKGPWRNNPPANEVCPGCGARLCRSQKSLREPLPKKAACRDKTSISGALWRDDWDYACAAYEHGKFCTVEGGSCAANCNRGDLALGAWDCRNFCSPHQSPEACLRAYGRGGLSACEACCACGGGEYVGA